MTRQATTDNLVRVKAALADKYERLARISNSKPRKANLLRLAGRFRQQSANAVKGTKK